LVPRLTKGRKRKAQREEKEMKRKAALIVIAAALLLSGCGNSSSFMKKETEIQPTTEHIYVDALQEASNASQFWKENSAENMF